MLHVIVTTYDSLVVFIVQIKVHNYYVKKQCLLKRSKLISNNL